MSKKNKMDIITTYIIPILLGGLLMWYTTLMTDKFQKQTRHNQETIENIANNISKVVDEISIKNDKIESNTIENIDISRQLSEILDKVNGLTIQTNLIASDIKNEQKVKGNLSLRLPKKEYYQVDVGAGNQHYYSRDLLLKVKGLVELNSVFKNIPILNLKLKDNELLVSTKLYDFNGNVVTEINENKWAVGANIFSKNWNEHALEIIDNKGNVALQLNLKNDKIIIRGIIPTRIGIMILTDDDYRMLDYNDKDLSSKLFDYSRKINRIFEHTGCDYLGSKMPLTQEETENNKLIKNRVKKLKKIDNKYLINQVNQHLKDIRELLYQNELNQSKIMYSSNTDDLSSLVFLDLQNKKREELSKKLLSDYFEKYKIESIAINNVLKTRVPVSRYKTFKEIGVDYEEPNNLRILNLIVDDIEIMSKLISKKLNNLSIDKIQVQTQKLIDDLDLIIEAHEKEDKVLMNKFFKITSEKKSNIDYSQIREQESLEKKNLKLKYELEYNLNHKMDAIILRKELIKNIPDYKAELNMIDHFYKNPSFYDVQKIRDDLEKMMELIK